MVDLAEIQAVYYMVAATGVLVAAAYYIATMRNSQKTRRFEIATNKLQLRSLEFYLSYHEVMEMTDWENYDDWAKKYGRASNWKAYAKYNYIGSTFDHVGKLYKDGMFDEEQMFELYSPLLTIRFWEVYKPIIMRMREASGYPELWSNFEYLYGESKRRYPSILPLVHKKELVESISSQ